MGGLAEPNRAGFDRNLWIWEENLPEQILLVADVARGDGKDFSCFHVTWKLYSRRIQRQTKLRDVCSNASLQVTNTDNADGVENNNIGYNVLEKLRYELSKSLLLSQVNTRIGRPPVAETMSNVVPDHHIDENLFLSLLPNQKNSKK